jgi:hypothetical protein
MFVPEGSNTKIDMEPEINDAAFRKMTFLHGKFLNI